MMVMMKTMMMMIKQLLSPFSRESAKFSGNFPIEISLFSNCQNGKQIIVNGSKTAIIYYHNN